MDNRLIIIPIIIGLLSVSLVVSQNETEPIKNVTTTTFPTTTIPEKFRKIINPVTDDKITVWFEYYLDGNRYEIYRRYPSDIEDLEEAIKKDMINLQKRIRTEISSSKEMKLLKIMHSPVLVGCDYDFNEDKFVC